MLNNDSAADELRLLLDHLRPYAPAWASLVTEISLLSPTGRELLASGRGRPTQTRTATWRHLVAVFNALDRLAEDETWADPEEANVRPHLLPEVLLCARARMEATRDRSEQERFLSVLERLARYSLSFSRLGMVSEEETVQ